MMMPGYTDRRSFSVAIILCTICVAAFATRLIPYHMSPYPFNNDSLTECGIAQEIVDSGRLEYSKNAPWYGSHSVATPSFSVLIAFFSAGTGVTPLECAQLLVAVLSVLTVGAFYLLGRVISGNLVGGLAAALGSVLLGTFVFTSGSAWKESLGISLLVLLLVAFVKRGSYRYRILMVLLLLLIPLVHHLVTAIAFSTMAFLVFWSWLYAVSRSSFGRRHLVDILTICTPIVIGLSYYIVKMPDLRDILTPEVKVLLMISSFAVVGLMGFFVISLRSHLKWTFAPFVGVAMATFLFLDYAGLVFPYNTSVSQLYVVLILASSFLVTIAWYGSEVVLEKIPLYRGVQLALFVSPLALIIYALLGDPVLTSQKLAYRTFDFFDIFIFIGLGTAIATLHKTRPRAYAVVGGLVVVCLVATFPFGYDSARLLGVRHDTQSYEVDALGWVDEHTNTTKVISDERLSYISWSMYGFVKDAALPHYLKYNTSISSGWVCMAEDRWASVGVNAFPEGTIVVPEASYEWVLSAANVFYIGGPSEDRAILFVGSEVGQFIAS